MTNTPLISVMMVTYNRPQYIRHAIESLQAQTISDWECIIICDDEGNETRDIIDSINDKRVRLLMNRQRTGCPNARNMALQLARGEYVAILDDDDAALPARFETQYNHFLGNPELLIDAGGMEIMAPDGQTYINANAIPHEMVGAFMFLQDSIANPTAMFHRRLIKMANGYYDTQLTFGEDYDLWLRLILCEKPGPIINIHDKILTQYRIHGDNSESSNLTPNAVKMRDIIYRRALNNLGVIPDDEQFRIHRGMVDYLVQLTNQKQVDIFEKWFSIILTQNRQNKILHEQALMHGLLTHIGRMAKRSQFPEFRLFGQTWLSEQF